MAKVVAFKDIPLDDLVIGKGQARVSNVDKDLDELVESIKKVGLLEPILVAPQEDSEKYEIILGQRRFLAHQKLHRDTITAGILDEQLSEIDAKVLSVTENLVRTDMNRKDLIDVCTHLYRHYGTITDVVEETGLSQAKVSDYVKYERLIPELRELFDSREVDLKPALRAQDALSTEGTPDPQEAVKLAKEMTSMSGPQQEKIKKELKTDPTVSVDEVIEDAKSGGKVTQIAVTLGHQIHRSLTRFAKDEEVTIDEAAALLIEKSGLAH